ncbi:hypothetical protein [Hyphomonas sp.]|uniref:hypothetical protein n=1 Tax=Hyphomonas sp. TaxID=87 RepID=UPI0032D9A72E
MDQHARRLAVSRTDRRSGDDRPDSVWGLYIDLGFTMIQTDEPELLIRYVSARQE